MSDQEPQVPEMMDEDMSQSAQPWEQPDEETQEAAEPISKELEKALLAIDTPEKAEALLERLETDTQDVEAGEAAAQMPSSEGAAPQVQAEMASAAVEQAADVGQATGGDIGEAAAAIETIAAEASDLDGPAYEALVAAVQEVTNPALTGEPEKLEGQRRLLRDTIMRRMSIFQRYDTALFIAINNGLHTPPLNRFFQWLSFVFNGGWAWLIGTALFLPFRRAESWRLLKKMSLPVWAAALVVEGPVKKYFRRRRPFIDVVRAIVVGKKPGNWSFPSGHAAAAFGGAHIMSRELPRWRVLWYGLAALVAFSRVYLGAHYPGDVMSGSLVGLSVSELARRVQEHFGWGLDE